MEISEELLQEKIKESFPKIIEDIFSSSYNSPLRKVVDEAIKSNEGIISKLVNEILTNALTDEIFKAELGKIVLTKIVEKGLRNN